MHDLLTHKFMMSELNENMDEQIYTIKIYENEHLI